MSAAMMLAVLLPALAPTQSSSLDVPPGLRPVTPNEASRPMVRTGFGVAGLWVSLDNDQVRVETNEEISAHIRKEPKSAPVPKPTRVVKFPEWEAHWSPRQGVEVEDGWIQGYDAGEWGGALIWFSKKGEGHRILSRRNTTLVARTRKGIFAIQSLTHMMFWYADLVQIVRTKDGWSTRVVTNLHVAPNPIFQDGDRFLYATSTFVSTLETDGTQRELYRPHFQMRVNSMVRRRNGELWLGTETAVLRLRPRPMGEYQAQWFKRAGTETETPSAEPKGFGSGDTRRR
jgi:hypothetical protein